MAKKILLLSFLAGISAFTAPSTSCKVTRTSISNLCLSVNNHELSENITRRYFMGASVAAIGGLTSAVAQAAQEKETRQGIEVTPFNGLIFNYRNSNFGGLDAKDLDEPSISYAEFCEKLKQDEVEFVEFKAPDGDVAYATLKGKEGTPIRIGAGYPIEQHDGWSSPAFAVRTVKNAGVPYKFTVPGLEKYKS